MVRVVLSPTFRRIREQISMHRHRHNPLGYSIILHEQFRTISVSTAQLIVVILDSAWLSHESFVDLNELSMCKHSGF